MINKKAPAADALLLGSSNRAQPLDHPDKAFREKTSRGVFEAALFDLSA
jgi:hypothetical protein